MNSQNKRENKSETLYWDIYGGWPDSGARCRRLSSTSSKQTAYCTKQ